MHGPAHQLRDDPAVQAAYLGSGVHRRSGKYAQAAASIIAKVQRDMYMIELSHKRKYKSYQFDRHK